MSKINISPEVQKIFDDFDNLSVEEKKAIARKRMENAKKSQGKIWFAPGFSFDSDSKIKLYEVTA